MFLGGDVAYRSGPLFSPSMYRELLQPAQKKICDFLHDHGMFVFYHTDGSFLPLASDIINTGIEALQPLEAKAGLDAAMIRNRLGQKVVLMGNIYAVKLCAGAERMKRELKSKLPILMRGPVHIQQQP